MPVFHSKRFAVTTTAHMPPNKYSSNQSKFMLVLRVTHVLIITAPAPCSAVARPKRRRAKANNDPGFKFIITNDPKEFKNKDNKKEVRSQAMRNHRWKDRNENSLAALALIAQSPPDSPQHEPVESLRVFSYNGLEQNEQYLDLPMPTIEQQHTSAPAVQSTFHTTAYDTALTNESCRTSESRVTGYEAAGGHQSFMVDMLLDDFAQHHSDFLADDGQIGVLPMISSLESSTEYLLFMCKSACSSMTVVGSSHQSSCTKDFSEARIHDSLDASEMVPCHMFRQGPYFQRDCARSGLGRHAKQSSRRKRADFTAQTRNSSHARSTA